MYIHLYTACITLRMWINCKVCKKEIIIFTFLHVLNAKLYLFVSLVVPVLLPLLSFLSCSSFFCFSSLLLLSSSSAFPLHSTSLILFCRLLLSSFSSFLLLFSSCSSAFCLLCSLSFSTFCLFCLFASLSSAMHAWNT